MKRVQSQIIMSLLMVWGMLMSAGLPAQDTWSLDRCLTYARDHNLQLKQQALHTRMARNNLSQSKFSLIPSLSAGAQQSFRFGRSVDPLTYSFNTENSKGSSFFARSRTDLFKGFQNLNTIRRNRLELEKSLQDYDKAKNDLTLMITRLYLQILFNEELLQVAESQVALTREQVSRTRMLVHAGSLPKGDLLDIQAQLASEELNRVDAQNRLDLSYLDLIQLLDLKNPGRFTIEKPDFNEFPISQPVQNSDQVFQLALGSLPQIKSAEYTLCISERDLAISKGRLSPSLSVSSYWGTGYSDRITDFINGQVMPFGDQLKYTGTAVVNLNLNIPLFSGLLVQTDIRNARLAVLNAQYQLEQCKNNLHKEIQQAEADARAAYKKYHATAKSVAALEEAFHYAAQKFNLGIVTSLDYNLAKNNLTKARSNLLQAKYHYIFNTKILDFYRGISITTGLSNNLIK